MPNSQQSRSALIWLWLALAVFVVDIATKQLAEALLVYAQPVKILPVFDLMLVYNPGAAFGFLADKPGWQRWFFTFVSLSVSIMLIVWLKRLPREQIWMPVALALILGGALGSLFDRLVYGHVIDFLSFHWMNPFSFELFGQHYRGYGFPVFNLADTAITAGAVMMAMDVVRESWQERRQAS